MGSFDRAGEPIGRRACRMTNAVVVAAVAVAVELEPANGVGVGGGGGGE